MELEAVRQHCAPRCMTVTVVMASLIPIMRSTGVGSDVMKAIAAPIIGGTITVDDSRADHHGGHLLHH